jgi:ethanolamine-phosphate cytidylyltransferase
MEQHSSEQSRTTLSRFLPTSRRLVQFSNGRVAPPEATIVYIDGAFDVFHPGHVKILKVWLRGLTGVQLA